MKKLLLLICCINLLLSSQTVNAQAPVADFVLSDSVAGFLEGVQCTDLSTGYPYFFNWSLNPPNYLTNTFFGANIQNTWNSNTYENPTIYLYDAGIFDVCLKVTNSIGEDSICKHAALKVVNGYVMCNGSDSLSTKSEGFLYDQGGPSGNYNSLTTGSCSKGFHLSPCADSVMLYVKSFRLASGDTLIIRKNGPAGSIIKNLVGNNLPNNLKTYHIAGNVFFQMHTHSGSQDSGFVIFWKTISGGVGFKINNPTQCINGNNFLFTDTSSFKSGIISRQWNFGTGNSDISSLISPSKSYTSSSTYPVKLVVTNGAGCSDSVTQMITVNPKPIAGYKTNNYSQCLPGDTFLFSDTSKINYGTISQQWNFGEGITDTSTIKNPDKIYSNINTYSVKLTETSTKGCKDSVIKSVYINAKPNTGFTINNISQCLNGNNFLFADTSTVSSGNLTRQWNLGSGINDTSTNINPAKIYSTEGTNNVRLIINNNGCRDTVIQTVYINANPNAGFTINNVSQCLNGNNFLFADTSTVSSGNLTRQWNFGSGINDTSTNLNPTKIYSTEGTNNVKLIVNNNGCKDSLIQTVTVNPKPSVGYTQNNFNECFSGNNFLLIDTSGISSGAISRKWIFSDGTNSTNDSLHKTFANDGTYSIKLFETSNHNCIDSVIKIFTAYPQPIVGFTQNSFVQCLSGNDFVLNDTSSISSGTMTRLWNFDNSIFSTNNPVNKNYLKEGIYQVKLMVISKYNCKDSVTKTFTVYPQTTIGFSVNNLNQCERGNNFFWLSSNIYS